MKPVVKLRSKEGKLYTPTLPVLPDELLIKIADQESVIKSNFKKRQPEQLKRALYGETPVLINKGATKRRISNVRRKLSHLKLK